MAVITHKADGGIIITASAQPRQWNALKLLNADGEFLSDAEGKQVLAMAEEEDYEYPTVDGIGARPFARTVQRTAHRAGAGGSRWSMPRPSVAPLQGRRGRREFVAAS